MHYFGAAAREAARYDEACRDYQRASLDTQLSLSLLNFGQSLIFSSGVSAALLLSANQVMAGTMTVGDVVMVHGLIFQLTLPLNILGSVYNMVRQATVDMNALTQLLQQKPAVTSVRGAPALSSPTRGRIEFDQARGWDRWCAKGTHAASTRVWTLCHAGALLVHPATPPSPPSPPTHR